jgi:branched-chain amino acid transport system substrate-binding protein
MKELPTDAPLFGKGEVRTDGRAIHLTPADQAFRPLAQSECPLVRK